jgi:hypothetical protein
MAAATTPLPKRKHDPTKIMWPAACGKHKVWRALDSVNRNAAALRCKVCGQTKRVASRWEQDCYALLAHMGWQFTVEAVVLSGKHGEGAWQSKSPVDVWVYDPVDLLISVDGEQHFTSSRDGFGKGVQALRDERFNQAALAQGWASVRLHYSDTVQQWERTLRRARDSIIEGASIFVMFTPCYQCEALLPEATADTQHMQDQSP